MAKLTVEEIYGSDKPTLIAAKKMIEEFWYGNLHPNEKLFRR